MSENKAAIAIDIGRRMIAERQREITVSMKALHLMQEHHGNRYFSFACVSRDEEREWYAKAEKMIEPITEKVHGRDRRMIGGFTARPTAR